MTDAALTDGPFSATPEHAIKAARLVDAIENAIQDDTLDADGLYDILKRYADGDISVEQAIREIGWAHV